MNCLKCGAETQERQVFCPNCQKSMKAYPVRPDTPVSLPVRKASPPPKKPAPRQPKPEEVIARLRRTVVGLSVTVAALVLALGISIFGLYILLQQQEEGPTIGQNYSTSPTSATTGTKPTVPGT